MSIAFALALAIGFQGQAVAPRRPDEQPLDAQLWAHNPMILHRMACNHALQARQQQQFDQRFKDRIDRLVRAYEAVNGADAPRVVVVPAMCRSLSGIEATRVFEKGLREYERFLRRAEKRWGVVPAR